MLTPEEPVKLHRIRNDQFYHYYLGDPIELLMMIKDGSTQLTSSAPICAPATRSSFSFRATRSTPRASADAPLVPRRLTEWPGVEPADVELGNTDELAAKYPSVAQQIRTYPLPAKG